MSKTVFCSVIFPANLVYFNDFIKSLEQQTDDDFNLLLFNDGIENLDDFLHDTRLNFEIIKIQGTIAETRTFIINYLKKTDFESVIFGDTDDFFSANRVEDSKKLLTKFDIVACDINIVNTNGEILELNYWKNREELKSEINANTIKEYNFLGLGNTALKINILPNNLVFDKSIIAIDWYLFTVILTKEIKTFFTFNSSVYYRQHEQNIVGRKKITFESFKKGFKVKLNHYVNLAKCYKEYEELANSFLMNQHLLSEDFYKKASINNNIKNPFWWEEIKL